MNADGAGAPPGDDTPFQSLCRRVTALPPTEKKPYWRLEYDLYGRRRQPSGGRTRAQAAAKMALVVGRLDAGLDIDRGSVTGDALLDRWLNPSTPRRGGKVWSPGTAEGHAPYVRLYIRPVLGRLRAEQFDRRHYRAVVASARTRKEGEQVRRRLQQFLRWAMTAGV